MQLVYDLSKKILNTVILQCMKNNFNRIRKIQNHNAQSIVVETSFRRLNKNYINHISVFRQRTVPLSMFSLVLATVLGPSAY